MDSFEYRLVRDTEFREAKLRRVEGEKEEALSTVTAAGIGPIGPPQIVQRPRSSKLLQGSDAIFRAKVGGNPKPKISWFRNGVRIASSNSPRCRMTYEDQIATLSIMKAEPEDTGHYTMLAENVSGPSTD